MKLYHLTAIPPSGITTMIHGSFTAPKQQELITASSSCLELYALHAKEGRLDPVMKTDVMAQIRALDVFRLPGTRRDYVVITSDSGSLAILSADAKTATFTKVHCEPFGKSGCRRLVPGEFLSCEPRGRACMIGAVEKQKFAYVLNRDAEENLTISSPLEAHKSNVATFTLISLDVGFENPMFAALERSYEGESNKMLVYYELDLGLNHVVRKHSSPVRESSSLILSVPGHTDGPGGVLVCSEGYVTYRNLLEEDSSGRLLSMVSQPSANGDSNLPTAPPSADGDGQIATRIPFREGSDGSTLMIVSGTVYHDKKRNAFFFLLCTEYGDLIKAEITWDADHGTKELRLVYFDTIPSPARAMCIFRSGFLAVAMEGSDALLFMFREVNVPDDDPAGGLSVSGPSDSVSKGPDDVMEIEKIPNGTSGAADEHSSEKSDPVLYGRSGSATKLGFKRRTKLKYLSIASVLDSFSPLLGICTDSPQSGSTGTLLCASGRATSGSIRAIRRGMSVMSLSNPHQLPYRVQNVFTLKDNAGNSVHRFIVVSFESRTKVLEVDETKVEEILTSGFELADSTLCAGQMATDSLLQVYKHGVRFIPSGRADDAVEWKPPVPTRIVAGTCNQEQVVIALSSGTIMYFEVDFESNSLQEMSKAKDVLVPAGGDESVSLGAGDAGATPSLSIPELRPGQKRAQYFAAADGANSKVRMFSISQTSQLEPLGLYVAPAPVKSLELMDFGFVDKVAAQLSAGSRKTLSDNKNAYSPIFTLLIGTKHGALVRLSVDHASGAMSGSRVKFLGPSSVEVVGMRIAGVPVCFCMGKDPWLLFPQGGRLEMSPLAADVMQHAASFSSEQSPDGFVATNGSELSLLSIDLIHALVNSALLPERLSSTRIPTSTLVGCSFNIARTHVAGTPRRIFPLAQKGMITARSYRVNGVQSNSHPREPLFVVIENDHRMQQMQDENITGGGAVATNAEGGAGVKTIPASQGSWFSRVQLVKLKSYGLESDNIDDTNIDDELDGTDPFVSLSPQAVEVVDFITTTSSSSSILTATSSAVFGQQKDNQEILSYIVVSQAKNMVVSATSRTSQREGNGGTQGPSYSLTVYKVVRGSQKVVLLHETPVPKPVHALVPFRDMLLAGVGTALRLYDLGKKQLLRKGEYKLAVRNKISALTTAGGDRIFVGDVQESVTMFKYIRPGSMASSGTAASQLHREGGSFVPIASDELPRWVVSLEALDYSTVCGSDKFGNLFILRLPPELAGATDEFVGVMSSERSGYGPGSRTAPHKLCAEACIHVGSTVIGLAQGFLRHSSIESNSGDLASDAADAHIIYSTLNGAIGVLAPLKAQGDVELLQKLEREMRKRHKSLCGRDHISYRSSFYPIRNIIDGDMCELFNSLSHADQEGCSESIARSVDDVSKRIEELRGEVW